MVVVRVVGWAQEAVGSPARGKPPATGRVVGVDRGGVAAGTTVGSEKASGKRGWEALLSLSLSHIWSTEAGSRGSEESTATGEPVWGGGGWGVVAYSGLVWSVVVTCR